VNQVVLAYSDLNHMDVMHKASLVNAAGADFVLMGVNSTSLKSKKPVISICAVRTGAGKSWNTRKVCSILKSLGKKVIVVRHPMPYGHLKEQACQRFETLEDLDKHKCTIEEREEYEPHIRSGNIVYAGIDYEKILRSAEKEADIILWDGGNNDLPFFRTNLHIVVADALRPGHEVSYYPGETNAILADVILINKVDRAAPEDIKIVEENVRRINPRAKVIKMKSIITVDDSENLKGKTAIVIEDGPTVTHGGMEFGAGLIAAKSLDIKVIDPRPFAVGSIKKTFEHYPHLHEVLPSMGYGDNQIRELEETINRADCDIVMSGTPANIKNIIKVNKPIYQVTYGFKEQGTTTLEEIIKSWIKSKK